MPEEKGLQPAAENEARQAEIERAPQDAAVLEETAAESPAQAQAAEGTENAAAQEKRVSKWKRMPRKTRRRIVRWIIIALVLLALIGGGIFVFKNRGNENEKQAVTDFVQYGSITSVVQGSGLTKARDSQSITLNYAGTVLEVYVSEGQMVEAGDPLFVVDSPNARSALDKARSNVEGYRKQLNSLYKDIAGLHLKPGYPGRLMDCVKLNPGDDISKGQKVATLADDTQLRLKQYYSYAYEGVFSAGQSVDVSIPVLMSSVVGKVEAVNMVTRITPEGSKLFSVDILIDNAGALTEGMVATAVMSSGGETIYPYEPGKLEYKRVGDLCSTVSGTVISSKLIDYLQVSPDQVLVEIDGDQSESELFSLQQRLEEAEEELRTAQENLDKCKATAGISGMVIGLSLHAGEEIPANTQALSISDTSGILISATVDERNISYVRPGMPVDLDQWGKPAYGEVESVSYSSTVENGVAKYPMTIFCDNSAGDIQVNSYIDYKITASQSENCLVLPLQAVRTVTLEDGSTATVVFRAGEPPEEPLVLTYEDEEIPEGFWPVQVEIGIQDSYNVEIKSGLEEGDEVFTQMMTTEAWG